MVEGYPDEKPPEIRLIKRRGLTTGQVESISGALMKRCQELIGAEMVFDLVYEAKNLLSMMAKKRVSFHDEMVKRRAEDEEQGKAAQREKQAKLDEADLARRLQITHDLDERIKEDLEGRERLVQAAVSQEERLMQARDSSDKITQVTFVPELVFPLNGVSNSVSSVTIKLGVEPVPWTFCEIHRATSESGLEFGLLLLKFLTPFYASNQGRKKLEALLRTIKEMSGTLPSFSSGLCRILGAQLEFSGTHPVLQVLVEPFKGARLDQVLRQAGALNEGKTCVYLRSILGSLGHLHLNGIVHRDVCSTNLYVSSDGSALNLAFPYLSRALLDLDQVHPISNIKTFPDDAQQRPPEALSKSNMSLGRKADIWQLGALTLQMLFGLEFMEAFDTVSEAFEYYQQFMSAEMANFVRKTLASDPAKRPLISDLLKEPVLSVNHQPSTGVMSGYWPPAPTKDSAISHRHSGKHEHEAYSRYKSDFEEIQFLGKGAFGAVIKVRNRIDNRYYAVKRIKLDKRNSEENQKILREVTTLSRLHHDRIIRYYQAWIEGEPDRSALTSPGDDADLTSDMAPFTFRTACEDNAEQQSNWLEFQDNSETIMSNSSLLKLAINHTGFSDTEEATANLSPISRQTSFSSISSSDDLFETEETDLKKLGSGPYLYIQMEYCPNQTLRDFIDEGLLDTEEVWRLFRQLLEGLAYIHSQGMIHRDLKPSNIFLDSNGDIKIGDFGLAVVGDKLDDVTASLVGGEMSSRSGRLSLTGAVGTPFYMSPEQAKEGSARYSNKVDMYSAGIIFVELCCGHFPTTMERIEMLKAVRSPAIRLPAVVGHDQRAKVIAQSLLEHDPKLRFSADELLKRSDLIPPKMEDESVKEAIRSLSMPGNAHYGDLVKALFSHPLESFKDFTFDLQSGLIQDPVLLGKMTRIREALVELWTSHGAIELYVPLLAPVTGKSALIFEGTTFQTDDLISFDRVELLDGTGALVQLPADLSKPFARFAAHNRLSDLRRFTFDRVYRSNPAGCQPRQFMEGAFDVLHPSNLSCEDILVNEACLIKTAYDSVALNMTRGSLANISIHISSTALVNAVASGCGVEQSQRPAVLELLSRTHHISWAKRRNILAALLNLSPTILDAFAKYQKPVALDRLAFLLRNESSAVITSFRKLLEHLNVLGLDVGKILFDPLFVLPPDKYAGIMFTLSFQPDRKISHTIAFGGRYDEMVSRYAYPRVSQTGALGFQLSLPRLALISDGLSERGLLDVLIFSSGTDPMVHEKLSVASDLWAASIKADFLNSPNPSPETLVKACKKLGIKWFIILKEHTSKGQFGTVKIREVEKRQETEVSRSELVEALLKMMGERDSSETSHHQTQIDHHAQLAPATPSGLVKVHILAGPFSKIKPVQRTQISERALKHFMPIFAVLNPVIPVEILAHELSTTLVKRLIEVMGESEEVFRRAMEGFPGEREAAVKFRAHLRSLKERGDVLAPLYNYRENTIDIVSLLK